MGWEQKAKQRAAALSPKATKSQLNFLEILLNDCGFGTRLQRMDFVSTESDREIKFLDELTAFEASTLIDQLSKRRKEEQNKGRPVTSDEEDDWYRR
jgi:hypothetical protein